jgi:CheY-like chemotaxis protein
LAASAAAAGVAIGKQDDVSAQEKEIAVANIASAFLNSPAPSNFAYSKNILWVDDIPDNNSSLVSAFRALGFEVTEALTTEVALQKVSENRYAVLISDMGRPPDGEAGLTLINSLRIRQIHIPTIIFAANWARIHKGEEEKYGVVKITNEASVVYTTVLNLVGVPTKRPRAIRWDEILREPRA